MNENILFFGLGAKIKSATNDGGSVSAYNGGGSSAEKRDVYGDGRSKALAAALKKQEKEWQKQSLDYEKLIAFSKGGKKLTESVGTGYKVTVPDDDQHLLKNAVITHVHPNTDRDFKGSLATRVGIPISDNDLRSAITNNAAEIRAASKGYVYSIRRPKNGWVISGNKAKDVWLARVQEYVRMYQLTPTAKKAFVGMSPNVKDSSYGRMLVAAENYALKYMANKYGWIYQRSKY